MCYSQRSGLADRVHDQPGGCLNATRIGGVIADAFAVRASAPGAVVGATASTLHAQHGAGLLVGLDCDVIVTAPGRSPVRGRVVAVPPDVPYAASGEGAGVGILYDPELAPHVAGYMRARGGAFAVEDRMAARLLDAATQHRECMDRPDVLAGLAQEASRWIADASPPRPRIDRRVARLLDALRAPEQGRAEVEHGISPAHLRALFVRDVGVPIRVFRLWRRLLSAIEAMAWMDATSAAHEAGFADLAHFSRTCRRMLGYSPTELRGSGP